MVGRQLRRHLLAALGGERWQQPSPQQVRRRLAAHVQLVAHLQALRGQVEDVDRPGARRAAAPGVGPRSRARTARRRPPRRRRRRTTASAPAPRSTSSMRAPRPRRPRRPTPASTASRRPSSARRGRARCRCATAHLPPRARPRRRRGRPPSPRTGRRRRARGAGARRRPPRPIGGPACSSVPSSRPAIDLVGRRDGHHVWPRPLDRRQRRRVGRVDALTVRAPGAA